MTRDITRKHKFLPRTGMPAYAVSSRLQNLDREASVERRVQLFLSRLIRSTPQELIIEPEVDVLTAKRVRDKTARPCCLYKYVAASVFDHCAAVSY